MLALGEQEAVRAVKGQTELKIGSSLGTPRLRRQTRRTDGRFLQGCLSGSSRCSPAFMTYQAPKVVRSHAVGLALRHAPSIQEATCRSSWGQACHTLQGSGRRSIISATGDWTLHAGAPSGQATNIRLLPGMQRWRPRQRSRQLIEESALVQLPRVAKFGGG